MGRISNYSNGFKKDYDNVMLKIEKLEKENKMLKLKLDIAESDNQRKNKIIAKQDAEIDETKKENEALRKELIEMKKKVGFNHL